MKNILSTFILFWKYNKQLAINLSINYHLLKRWISKNKDYKKGRSIEEKRKIIFLLKESKTGLQNVKGVQPRDALRKKGILSETYTDKLPENIDNSIIVFIKFFPFKEVLKAIKKNCILVYEIMDNYNPFLLENEKMICDAIIFPNKTMQTDFKYSLSPNVKSLVIPHHWDSRFGEANTKQKDNEFSLAYFGSNHDKNAIFSDKLNIPRFTNFPDHLKYKDKFNCLYSMRKEGTHDFLYKPSTKVVTASAIGANIITSKEPSAVELLGEDYPYFTDTDFPSVKKTIEYAKKTFGKEVWFDALKTMKKIKKKTDINFVVDSYIKLLHHFNHSRLDSSRMQENPNL